MDTHYLLDTCVWLDFFLSPELLSPAVRKKISQTDRLYLSCISLLEVARKVSMGKLKLSHPIDQWLTFATNPKWIQLLPLTPAIAVDATHLPAPFANKQGKTHKDPADQIIVATARYHGLTLLTSDKILLAYPHASTLQSRA